MKRLYSISWIGSQLRRFALGLAAVALFTAGFAYRPAVPGRKLIFPQDHFSHPDFKTEWWYYTGHLETESGGSYGYQVTFFRAGLRDRQSGDKENPPLFTDLYLAHFALSDKQEKKFVFHERVNRGYAGKAGAATDRYLVWNENWKVEAKNGAHEVFVQARDASLTLRLIPLKRPVLHGQNGFSRKGEGEGRASYYYSLTRMQAEGQLELAGKKERVRGSGWMDHEFGSNQLAEEQAGWDWFSLQLNDRTEIMLYLMRRRDGSHDPHSSGTFVYADGNSRHLPAEAFRVEVLDRWKSPRSGGTYPMKWRVEIPSARLSLEVEPFFPGQELETRKSTQVTYWEGAAQVRGNAGSKSVEGLGYVEMTGYVGKLRM